MDGLNNIKLNEKYNESVHEGTETGPVSGVDGSEVFQRKGLLQELGDELGLHASPGLQPDGGQVKSLFDGFSPSIVSAKLEDNSDLHGWEHESWPLGPRASSQEGHDPNQRAVFANQYEHSYTHPHDISSYGTMGMFSQPIEDGIGNGFMRSASQELFPNNALIDAPRQAEIEENLVGLDGSYQPYCSQVITPQLNIATQQALHTLKNLQNLDPSTPGRLSGKRYFCSLKEVSKVTKNCRLLIIAPDVKPSSTSNIKPVRMLQSVIRSAEEAGVPYIFALSRRGIGQVFGRDKSMSIVAVMNLEHIERECTQMVEEAMKGRQMFAAHKKQATGLQLQ